MTVAQVATREGGVRELSWRTRIEDVGGDETVVAEGRRWDHKTAAKARDTFTFGEAKRFCAALGGRVPAREELVAIVVPGRMPAVDPAPFANVTPYANYWTASEWRAGSGLYDVVAFWDAGRVFQQKADVPAAVLCTFEGTGNEAPHRAE